MLQLTASIVIGSSIVMDYPKRAMPYETWQPFNLSTDLRYTAAFAHHTVAHVWGTLINISYDTLVSGLILLGCIQLKILGYRLKSIPTAIKSNNSYFIIKQYEERQLAKCVNYHLLIFKLSPLDFCEIINWVILCPLSNTPLSLYYLGLQKF